MLATEDEAIDACGGTGAVAEALGLGDSTVSGWRERGIPPGRWPELVALAKDLGLKGITFEALAALHAKRSSAASAPELTGAQP